ncbi:excinuclease ABC subunit UvrC [Thiohalophilus thiocyanatoxydans]|uniref:UvrABC system protein C n=1 Tax=Thiohalophilus thiocyanatoxydans TaxID=381308 RepID=A0A4R8IYA1_9GAMM|nr:excinuclease ABC subunit UvrC [Thiohalophilus thiocyanatoxydans]TDY02809.1 excinuclease ABC subunit C [Thiohalophilus thiocyanatoxydans]
MSATTSDFDAKAFIKGLPNRPGVYRMLDAGGTVIYVGKAVDLKKRVSSYFRTNLDSPKTRVMVAQIAAIEVTVTSNESEALILENTQIKSLRPRYNVLFRDDKSYPYIYLSTEHPYPRLTFHRGAKRGKGRYFGPYPSAPSVRETLSLLQKLFPVRQCRDSFYSNRSRPCLQYQIKRCTAPCVGLISEADYAEDVRHAILFLEGKSSVVIDALAQRMAEAAEALDYEAAARYRDQIASLRHIQDKQYMDSDSGGSLDVIAAAVEGGVACVQIFTIRQGRNLGNRSYFPKHLEGLAPEQPESELISHFLTQHYLSRPEDIPAELIVSHPPAEQGLIEAALGEAAGRRVTISHKLRGTRARWRDMATQNARQALGQRLNSQATQLQRFEALQEALQLDEQPQRLECFDISHTMGEATVASCVVFDINGPLKSDYRRFNIEGITPGDDYAAMEQALTRRYKRLREGEGKLPDILFIDGGKGQVQTARNVLEELQVPGVRLIGIAKGPGRKPGLETLYLSDGGEDTILPADSKALHLIQQIRDEAHRFAITGHRQRRQKTRSTSTLEQIPGLGPRRRQNLLHRFGGLQEIARAGVEDLAAVNGISRKLAQQIYDTFHQDGY